MKKTLIKWQWMYAFVAMAMLVGCQQDMAEADLNPETSKQMDVIVTAKQGAGVDSRVSYTPQEEADGTTVIVKWEGKPEEMIAYSWYNVEGVHLGYLPAIENSISDDGKSQQFGGQLNINDGVNGTWHYLFYPLPWDSWITKDDTEKTLTIRYPMNNQVQDCTEGNETKHLEAYNIMNVMNSQLETGSATIGFEHYTSLLYMDLTLPESNTISSIKLVSEQAMFGTEYFMKFILSGAVLGQGTEDDKMSTSMTLTLQNDAEDASVKGYLMLTPYYVKENESTTFYVEATATNGTVYKSEDITVSATGYLFNAGKCKTLRRTLAKVAPQVVIKTADEAVKGDLAMADGTFISKDDIDNLTDEQKANVRGIVFWTESEDGNATLTSDAVMNAAYNDCTHGLIVSLTDVFTSCVWQSSYESVYDNFQSTHDTYQNYVAIESETGASDNINKILGYNNTKVLEAYNDYCKRTNKKNYLVKPIEALAEWKGNNPDITGTTGWFIPSVKELTLLCGKDVDGVWTNNSGGTDTKTAMNTVLSSLGGTYAHTFGNNCYWSSSEGAGYYAFDVYFNRGDVYRDSKVSYTAYVRAVCAF